MSSLAKSAPVSYLEQFDATPVEGRFALVRQWIDNEPLSFFAELRDKRVGRFVACG